MIFSKAEEVSVLHNKIGITVDFLKVLWGLLCIYSLHICQLVLMVGEAWNFFAFVAFYYDD